jgi:NADH-quinone oxidoreductase subunit J
MSYPLFFLIAVPLVAAALGVVASRNPIRSALCLVAALFLLAVEFVFLGAHLVAALQIVVYAGAIMVLFLFVIMLLSLSDSGPVLSFTPSRVLGGAAVVGLFVALSAVFRKLPNTELGWTQDAARLQTFGSIKHLGEVMYTQWLFPFEAVSLLLLVAILGAVVVAKPRI